MSSAFNWFARVIRWLMWCAWTIVLPALGVATVVGWFR